MATFADRLTARFQESFGARENFLAALKKRHPDVRLTWDMLFELLQGRQDNPSASLLEALADVLGVDPAYFLASRYAEDALHPLTREAILAPLELDDEEYAALSTVPSLATKLSLLIDVARDPLTKKAFSFASLAKRLTASGISTTPGYLVALGAGTKRNPSKAIIEGLASIFRVDAAYFVTSVYAWPIFVELGWLRQLQKADLQYVAARAVGGRETGSARLHQILRLIQEETKETS